MSIGHKADTSFLAVSPQVTLVINPMVGCHYFPRGPWVLSQPKGSLAVAPPCHPTGLWMQ